MDHTITLRIKQQTMDMLKWLVAAVVTCAIAACGVFIYKAANPPITTPVPSRDNGVITADEWKKAFPEITASYKANGENTYIVDYLEEDPYLVSIYEGYGFAKQYGSARGHEYCLEDLNETARPHALANCLTCKTADFTKLVQDQGVAAYSLDFNEVFPDMSENVGCYNCHGNEALDGDGKLVVTHDYIIDRLGDNMASIDAATLSCGQCHIEYYFVPETKATSVPYTDVATMSPDAILAYYDEIGFADWTQESTGAKMLKAQHPEMETFLGEGSKHVAFGMNCASCHMEKVTKGGKTYTSHELVSPLDSPAILDTCAACHKGVDMAEKVHTIQAQVTERESKIGNDLAAFKQALAEANASGSRSEDELNAIRQVYRSAQWYFDFDYVENSEGAHNSMLANDCLDKAADLIEEGMALLSGNAPQGSSAWAVDAKDGTYTAKAQGFGGEIVAEVVISGGNITDIKLTGDKETEGLGSVAIEKMPGRFMKSQTVNVDGVSGASVSSGAIKQAVTDALAQAGIDASKLTGKADQGPVVKTTEIMDVDVVVVGAGGAGMSAAITAKQDGKNVLILEKMPYVGGNTTKASGGMNAAGTKMQEAAIAAETDEKVKASLEDSTVENFIADTIRSGHDLNDPALVRTMAEKSSDAVDWLESIGAPLPKVAATGSTVHMYLHEPEDGSAVGEYLVKSFSGLLEQMDIPVLLDTTATEIVSVDGKAVGVKAESEEKDYIISAKAVILATGGFGANEEMYCSYRPDLKGTVTTNTPGATGDGIVMAQALGADLVDIEQIQLHPTVFQKDGMLVSERVRSNGAILVNENGERFINDLAGRDVVSGAELEQPNCNIFIIYDSQYTEEKLYQKYESLGMPVKGETIEDLAAAIGFDADATKNFVETVAAWNEVVAGNAEDAFGRNNGLVPLEKGPFYAINIAPGIHHTMGGIKIDTETHVIDTDGNVIPGLFAAGEVTGGVHGGNRVGGNAVADIVVFGRIAGANACAYADAQ